MTLRFGFDPSVDPVNPQVALVQWRRVDNPWDKQPAYGPWEGVFVAERPAVYPRPPGGYQVSAPVPVSGSYQFRVAVIEGNELSAYSEPSSIEPIRAARLASRYNVFTRKGRNGGERLFVRVWQDGTAYVTKDAGVCRSVGWLTTGNLVIRQTCGDAGYFWSKRVSVPARGGWQYLKLPGYRPAAFPPRASSSGLGSLGRFYREDVKRGFAPGY